jgi:hypothetical protein
VKNLCFLHPVIEEMLVRRLPYISAEAASSNCLGPCFGGFFFRPFPLDLKKRAVGGCFFFLFFCFFEGQVISFRFFLFLFLFFFLSFLFILF